MLFGLIRSSLGLNNNPTVVQFESALRKTLLGAVHRGQFENTIPQDDTYLPIAPSAEQNYQFFTQQFDLNDEIDSYTYSLDKTSEFKSLALNYNCNKLPPFINFSKARLAGGSASLYRK